MPTADDALARNPRASEGARCLGSGRSHRHEEERHDQKAAGAWGIIDADADSMLASMIVCQALRHQRHTVKRKQESSFMEQCFFS